MPFDAGELDTTTLLLLKLRDRLTTENWRPCAVDPASYALTGHGCLLQQLWRAAGQRIDSQEYREVIDRLKDILGVHFAGAIGKFNDTHSLEEVQAAVDKAIAG